MRRRSNHLRALLRTTLAAAVALTVAAFLSAAVAQELPRLPGGSTEPQVETADLQPLIDLLQDDARRAEFVANLEALLAAQEPVDEQRPVSLGQRITRQLSLAIDRISKQTVGGIDTVLNVPGFFRQLGALVADPAVRARWLEISIKLLVVLLPAGLAFSVARRFLAKTRKRMGDRQQSTDLGRLVSVLLRMIVDIVPIVVFAIVAYAVLPLVQPRPFTRIVAISAINVTVMVQVALLIARAALVPHAPNLRIIRIGDETAAYIYVWVRRLAYLTGYVYVVAGALGLLGLARFGITISHLGGLTIAVMLIIITLQNRAPVRRVLRGGDGPAHRPALRALRRQFAEAWHVLAIVYVTGTFLVWSLQVPGGFAFLLRGTVVSLLVIAAAKFLTIVVDHAVTRGFSVGAQLRERYPTLEHRANRYLPVLRMVAVGVVMLIAAAAVLEAWQIGVSQWLTSEFGARFVAAAATVAIVLVLAMAVWEMVTSAVEHYLNRTDDEGELVERSARERTLLPLLRNALLMVLVVVVALIVLSEIGINIAPLLAAAGVVGIAIGFGSQKLVQDIINGLFILFEDTISVGDVVDVAGHKGLVESLSVRNLTLRDLEGYVHTIPFSEVTTILNMTKEFSFALMDIGIAYRENVAEVIDVLKQIGAELEVDPDVGPLILEPIEILGLDEFADSAIVVKARIKTQPIKQWTVKRAFNLRMKERFDELGIEIPFPHMTMYFGEDKAGAAPPAHISLSRATDGRSTVEETLLEIKDGPTTPTG